MEDYFKPDIRWEMYGIENKEEYAEKVVVKGYFHDQIPEDVVQAFRTAEYLMAHAYYHWEMFDEAFNKCLFILEMAIKIRAEQKEVVTKRKKVNGEYWHRPIKKVINDLYNDNYFREFKNQLHRARELRNNVAHPEQHSFMGPNGTDRNIMLFVNLINRVFQNEKKYLEEIRKVRNLSIQLSEINESKNLVIKKGETEFVTPVFELNDFELTGESLALIIHPCASEEMLKRETFVCSDPILFTFHEPKITSNKIQGTTNEDEHIELLHVNNRQLDDLKKKYTTHLENLSHSDIYTSLSYMNSTSSWAIVQAEYELNKQRYKSEKE